MTYLTTNTTPKSIHPQKPRCDQNTKIPAQGWPPTTVKVTLKDERESTRTVDEARGTPGNLLQSKPLLKEMLEVLNETGLTPFLERGLRKARQGLE